MIIKGLESGPRIDHKDNFQIRIKFILIKLKLFERRRSKIVAENMPKHKCEICDTVFLSRTSIYEHNASIHSGNKFKCSICNCTYTSKHNLKIHTQFVHEKKIVHNCEFCDANFSRKCHLQRHISVVHEERKFKCLHCDSSFVDKS